MRAYIVTLLEVPESVRISQRCAQSAQKFGLNVQVRPGVWRDAALEQLAVEGLRKGVWDESWSNTPAVIGNFVAQYRIWQEICAGEPAIIMEHDAVVVAPIPDLSQAGDIVTLGKPSFGKLRPRESVGFYPLFSTGDKIPGAHGYYVTPAGAAALVATARREGAEPVDKFIRPQRFAIAEYFPWPIEAHDSFTTIQREKGCRSKHNWGEAYAIL